MEQTSVEVCCGFDELPMGCWSRAGFVCMHKMKVVLHNRGFHRVQISAGCLVASALDGDNHIRIDPGERCLVCL